MQFAYTKTLLLFGRQDRPFGLLAVIFPSFDHPPRWQEKFDAPQDRTLQRLRLPRFTRLLQ